MYVPRQWNMRHSGLEEQRRTQCTHVMLLMFYELPFKRQQHPSCTCEYMVQYCQKRQLFNGKLLKRFKCLLRVLPVS